MDGVDSFNETEKAMIINPLSDSRVLISHTSILTQILANLNKEIQRFLILLLKPTAFVEITRSFENSISQMEIDAIYYCLQKAAFNKVVIKKPGLLLQNECNGFIDKDDPNFSLYNY